MSKQGWKSMTWTLGMCLALALSGCKVPADQGHRDACAPVGCEVPTDAEPLYVALCPDVNDGTGPCVGQVGNSGMWVYVFAGGTWPIGRTVELCPTEDGGPVPCAWVPSVQGNELGDSGAYVFGVTDPEVTAHSPADFAAGK